MARIINGSRIDMENKAELEYLLTLIDEAERVISSDPLAEDSGAFSYGFKEETVKSSDFHTSAVSCHECDGYLSRTVFPRPILKKNARVMFVMAKPDGQLMLEGQRIADFRKWWHDSLLLQEGEWALTSLIKCPVAEFSDGMADKCRGYLKDEMEEYTPSALILLGLDVARYMLRSAAPIEKFMKHRFLINHIPAFVSPSLDEYAAAPLLRRAIWENFLFIRDALSLDKRPL